MPNGRLWAKHGQDNSQNVNFEALAHRQIGRQIRPQHFVIGQCHSTCGLDVFISKDNQIRTSSLKTKKTPQMITATLGIHRTLAQVM